jgi:hypothetical protein
VSDEKPLGERIAVLETQADQSKQDIARVAAGVADGVKRERILILGIAAFLASQFFDIFRGQP